MYHFTVAGDAFFALGAEVHGAHWEWGWYRCSELSARGDISPGTQRDKGTQALQVHTSSSCEGC